jgi:hypothetical protein
MALDRVIELDAVHVLLEEILSADLPQKMGKKIESILCE